MLNFHRQLLTLALSLFVVYPAIAGPKKTEPKPASSAREIEKRPEPLTFINLASDPITVERWYLSSSILTWETTRGARVTEEEYVLFFAEGMSHVLQPEQIARLSNFVGEPLVFGTIFHLHLEDPSEGMFPVKFVESFALIARGASDQKYLFVVDLKSPEFSFISFGRQVDSCNSILQNAPKKLN